MVAIEGAPRFWLITDIATGSASPTLNIFLTAVRRASHGAASEAASLQADRLPNLPEGLKALVPGGTPSRGKTQRNHALGLMLQCPRPPG
jgi:hypothetical protein